MNYKIKNNKVVDTEKDIEKDIYKFMDEEAMKRLNQLLHRRELIENRSKVLKKKKEDK